MKNYLLNKGISGQCARILDKNIGGTFGFECDTQYSINQKYIPFTKILVTRYEKVENRQFTFSKLLCWAEELFSGLHKP